MPKVKKIILFFIFLSFCFSYAVAEYDLYRKPAETNIIVAWQEEERATVKLPKIVDGLEVCKGKHIASDKYIRAKIDFSPFQKRKGLISVSGEYLWKENTLLRGEIKQEARGNYGETTLLAEIIVGMDYRNWRIDFSYKPKSVYNSDINHYLSFTYMFDEFFSPEKHQIKLAKKPSQIDS